MKFLRSSRVHQQSIRVIRKFQFSSHSQHFLPKIVFVSFARQCRENKNKNSRDAGTICLAVPVAWLGVLQPFKFNGNHVFWVVPFLVLVTPPSPFRQTPAPSPPCATTSSAVRIIGDDSPAPNHATSCNPQPSLGAVPAPPRFAPRRSAGVSRCG